MLTTQTTPYLSFHTSYRVKTNLKGERALIMVQLEFFNIIHLSLILLNHLQSSKDIIFVRG